MDMYILPQEIPGYQEEAESDDKEMLYIEECKKKVD